MTPGRRTWGATTCDRATWENFAVSGLSDREVCIGDRYRIGEAEFEVTHPRVTCFRVGVRLGEPEMPNLLVSHRRPGFYFRVITEGLVQAGDMITAPCAAATNSVSPTSTHCCICPITTRTDSARSFSCRR